MVIGFGGVVVVCPQGLLRVYSGEALACDAGFARSTHHTTAPMMLVMHCVQAFARCLAFMLLS